MKRPLSVRGYSLPLVLGLLAMLAAALSVFLISLISSAKVTGSMIDRRKTFYACDSAMQAIIKHTNDYLINEASPTPGGLVAHVTAEGGGTALPDLIPNGFDVTRFDADFDPASIVLAPLPNGPFEGMQAQQIPVTFELEAANSTTGFVCGQRQDVTLAQISLFQFIVFSDTYMDTASGSGATFFGRTHMNDDFCTRGAGDGTAPTNFDGGPYHEFVTVAGRLMHEDDAQANPIPTTPVDGGRCREFLEPFGASGISMPGVAAAVAVAGDFTTLDNDNDNGCTNCAGGALDWTEYAIDTWGGQVRDEAHGVPVLRPPVAANTQVQAGHQANIKDSGDPLSAVEASNAGGLRFLVDPFRPAVDTVDVALEKYACKADIRIIDGVWFMKPNMPADQCGWPGIPIWSDHIGNFTMTAASHPGLLTSDIDVGQAQIASLQAPPNKAKRYSVYDLSIPNGVPPANDTLNPRRGVVSYGNIAGTGTGTARLYDPGYVSGTETNTVTPISAATEKAEYLLGTLSGFANGHIQTTSRPGAPNSTFDIYDQAAQANVLPMNFDVAAFQEALADTAVGELGDRFSARGTPFNGIVYVTASWLGHLDGFPDAHPTMPPPQGEVGVGGSGRIRNPIQTRLPLPLCVASGTAVTLPTLLPTNVETLCPESAPGVMRPPTNNDAQINALRVINARNINHNNSHPVPDLGAGVMQLPDGLSIVSNLPVYVVGDANFSSDADNSAATKAGTGGPGDPAWFPLMIGGDTVTLVSNAWSDSNAGWATTDFRDGAAPSNFDVNLNLLNGQRCPIVTQFNIEMLTGSTPTNNNDFGGGVINLPQFIEDWQTNFNCGPAPDIPAIIRGSLVNGFHRVHATGWGNPSNTVYGRPLRDWAFDTHLETLRNQPPGAPLFDVNAISRWSRY